MGVRGETLPAHGRATGRCPGAGETPLTRLVLDVSLRPTLGRDLRDVHFLVLNLNLRRKHKNLIVSERGDVVRAKPTFHL